MAAHEDTMHRAFLLVAALCALPTLAHTTPRNDEPPAVEEAADPPMATQQDRARQALARWQNDPVLFADEVLGVKTWGRQAEFMRAVAEHPRVAVRSGHKIGKSTGAAATALWWVLTRPRATVVLTSSSYRQVKGILWKELRRLHREARVPIGGKLAEDPETGLQFVDGREIVGLSTKEPERIAGYSGANLLFIPDEASGIPEPIFEAIEGNRAGGARVAMLSNPTRTSGTFFDAFNAKRRFWRTLHVSSEETPNATGIGTPIPGLATAEWVAEKRDEWGPDSAIYQVRVRGNFPTEGDNTVIALGLVEAARQRWDSDEADGDLREPVEQAGRLHLGIDVARFGDDDSAIVARRGQKVQPAEVVHGQDTMAIAGMALRIARDLRQQGEEKPLLKVDVIGVGAGVADRLREHDDVEVVDVNVAESAWATDREGRPQYANLRSQLWFTARDFLKGGGTCPPDAKLEGELVAPVYSIDSQGRYVVESKDRMKARLGRSPDRADSFALAVYSPPGSGFFIV
jgi:phage terminase large subunit